MAETPDYILDIQSLKATDAAGGGDGSQAAGRNSLAGRPWLAVKWRCCSVYSRVYRNREGTAYEGRCPRCSKPVRARVGKGGTDARFFEAG